MLLYVCVCHGDSWNIGVNAPRFLNVSNWWLASASYPHEICPLAGVWVGLRVHPDTAAKRGNFDSTEDQIPVFQLYIYSAV